MAPYIYGVREGVHVIDLNETVGLLGKALRVLANVLRDGGNVLFVGNRRENALLSGALGKRYKDRVAFINTKWVGGTLTNWETFDETKKRLSIKKKTKNKRISNYLQGFPSEFGQPDLIILLNVNSNRLLIREAATLHIPIIGIVDTNSDPEGITYPIPGNDDSVRSQFFYCQAFSYVMNKSFYSE
jgi:small subunit ribosomal protein S2